MVRVKPWNWGRGGGSIPLYGTPPVTSDWEKWVKTPSWRNWEGHWEGQLPQGLSLGRSLARGCNYASSQGPAHPSRREDRLRADGLWVQGGRTLQEAGEGIRGADWNPDLCVSSSGHVPKSKAGASLGLSFPLTEGGDYPS